MSVCVCCYRFASFTSHGFPFRWYNVSSRECTAAKHVCTHARMHECVHACICVPQLWRIAGMYVCMSAHTQHKTRTHTHTNAHAHTADDDSHDLGAWGAVSHERGEEARARFPVPAMTASIWSDDDQQDTETGGGQEVGDRVGRVVTMSPASSLVSTPSSVNAGAGEWGRGNGGSRPLRSSAGNRGGSGMYSSVLCVHVCACVD